MEFFNCFLFSTIFYDVNIWSIKIVIRYSSPSLILYLIFDKHFPIVHYFILRRSLSSSLCLSLRLFRIIYEPPIYSELTAVSGRKPEIKKGSFVAKAQERPLESGAAR